jgi:ATP-dependent helicase/nuclease subunit B
MPSLTLLNEPDHLLPQVVEFLTEGWNIDATKGILDLSGILLVLPTQESQRRLHEALVRKAAAHNSALLPPRWMLPMHLTEGDERNFAHSSQEQILWIQVITGMSTEESQRLFPRKSPRLDPLRAAELADSIRRLRGELSQVGISLRDAGAKKPEDPRWKALVSLEERYLALIAKEGATDRIITQLAGAENPRLPLRAKRLVIAGVPDLPKVYETMIPKIEAQDIPVDLLVYDPANKGERFFDSLGQPGAPWEKTPIPIDRKIIHLCLDPAETAEKAALLARASGGTGSTSAVAVTSPDLAKVIQEGLETLDIPTFNPAGTSLETLPLGRLFTNLSELLRENDFRSALQLLRHPHIQYWLGMDPEIALAALDALQNHLIPFSLADLLARWPVEKETRFPIPEHLRQALQKLHLLILELKEGSGSTPLFKALQEIYASVDLAKITGGRESSERIREWISGSESLMAGIPTADLLILLLDHLKSGVCMTPKQPDSVELPGWLELLWEDVPHLIVTGMNDGLVPEMRQGDPFLNETLRRGWHLPSDNSRLRRDSYLLTCLIAARSEERGRIDLLLARQDEEGGTLKPSRLLLRCAEDVELPLLVKELFRELPPSSRCAMALCLGSQTGTQNLAPHSLRVGTQRLSRLPHPFLSQASFKIEENFLRHGRG